MISPKQETHTCKTKPIENRKENKEKTKKIKYVQTKQNDSKKSIKILLSLLCFGQLLQGNGVVSIPIGENLC